ncbi:hypothetical protein FOA43_001003 [Brettanomyces nanus]|uniref:Uncharacterized protein n=1 Tax=Eeniella nana TaxID=13502 RepID=A0A875RNH2_EENNA|nr:uncharacterized protein FOA43_001003 [Brettanomyces nanus]QPG73690.1 hypothetical protein FOA43_001003 [Brettanomyces nanus]
MLVGRTPFSMEDLHALVDKGDIARLFRSPSCYKKYQKFKVLLESSHIDLTTNIVVTQLKWLPTSIDLTSPSSEILPMIHASDNRPFSNVEDLTIVPNMFPYYLEEGLIHLCVWLKFPFPPDPHSEIGDISEENKQLVEKYVNQTFVKGLGLTKDRVLWFKNYAALQSIRTIPHIHVVIDHPDPIKVAALLGTGGIPIKYTKL